MAYSYSEKFCIEINTLNIKLSECWHMLPKYK